MVRKMKKNFGRARLGILLIFLALLSGCLQQKESSTTTTIITTPSTILTSTTTKTTSPITTTLTSTTTSPITLPTTLAPTTITTKLRLAEISLEGMFCPACAPGAEWAFKNMEGVKKAEVSFATKKGKVIYDSKIITKEELIQNSLIQAYQGKILSDKEYQS